eukprot:558418-Pyramimonas_sp.AAC.2
MQSMPIVLKQGGRVPGVHNGDSGVALEQQHGGRHAHNVGAPQHYRVLALDLHPAAVQQLDAPLGRTEHGQSCGKDGQGTLQCHRERRDKVARVDTSQSYEDALRPQL